MTQLPSLPGENSQLSPNLLHAGKLERLLSCVPPGQPVTVASRASEARVESKRMPALAYHFVRRLAPSLSGRTRGDLTHSAEQFGDRAAVVNVRDGGRDLRC